MSSRPSFLLGAEEFLERWCLEQTQHGIQIEPHWILDHICYRVPSLEVYEQFKAKLCEWGKLVAESPVNGRPISTFRMASPISIQGYRVDYLELPAPKPGKAHSQGFDHVEVVVDRPLIWFANYYSNLSIRKNGMAKALGGEIEIQLTSCSTKFRNQTLNSMIQVERTPFYAELLDFIEHSGYGTAIAMPSSLPTGVDLLVQEVPEVHLPFKGVRWVAPRAGESFESLLRSYQDLEKQCQK